MQTLSNVLNMPIDVCRTDQACALGAAMFAATAAGLYSNVEEAQQAMSSGFAKTYTPQTELVDAYDRAYKRYLELGRYCEATASL